MIRVKVPATSANMGPGFDSLGIALNRYNVFEFEEIEEGLVFEGIPKEYCTKDNIIYEAMMKCFKRGNYETKGIKIAVINQDIPISRGLGSSSSCIVAGLMGANYIMGTPFNKDEIFQMAIEMEGHPDNVAPAVFGGMVVAIMENEKAVYESIKIEDDLTFVTIVPDFKLETKEARGVLPSEISLKDGIYNSSRIGLLIAAIYSKNYELLKYGCSDRFHEIYRSKLIKGFEEIKEVAMEYGALATFLSGAGPTIMAIVKNGLEERFSNKMINFLMEKEYNYEVFNLKIDRCGATIDKGDRDEK